MTNAHEKHLSKILSDFSALVDKKYRKGQKEHKGFLLEKIGIIDMAIEEVADLAVYLLTLKQQIDDKTLYTVNKKDKI